MMGLLVALPNVSAQQGQVMKLLSRYTASPAAFDQGAAEVVAYDPLTKHAVISNAPANKITFVNLTNPASPVFVRDVLLNAYNGYVNSLAIKNGLVAVALEDGTSKANPGKVLLFDNAGGFRSSVTVGALPDMLTFTPDGQKIVVCNEAEPLNNYAADPEGSVSIITVTNPAAPTVQTVGFTSLNGKQDSLRHMGIRIYGRNATVAQDFEPEYAAITADGRTAYVTLQENNALAIIDIATATLTRVVALGYKDYSRGLPQAQVFEWANRPDLGVTAAGQTIKLGGFSGLWFEGFGSNSNKLRFLTHPDRGPNAEPVVLRGSPRRPFALPNYQAEVVRFELDKTTGAFTIIDRVKLWRQDGTTPISGRPNLQAAGQGIAYTDEFGVDLNGNDIPNDAFGGDLEGISVDALGTWWMIDEYRPAIYNFAPNGTLINRYVAAGTAASVGAAAGAYGVEALPSVYAQRRNNRGFEACAIEGDILYAFIQSPIDNPDVANDASSRASAFCRILAFNTVTKTVVGEYLYPMHERFAGTDKIGDAVSIGNGKFMVVERDDATGIRARKYVFEVDLKGATNLVATPPTLPLGRTIESLTFAECTQYGIRPVHKKKSVFLPGVGYGDVDKVEGIARIDANTFAVINDNDFGVGGSVLPTPPNGTITVNPNAKVLLGLITFDRPNGLDGSDRDNLAGSGAAINIRNWPVYGMYQPDAMQAVTVGGETYLITANEGDAREWGDFVEEARVSSSSIVLDPAFAAAWPSLKTNQQIGRLNITNALGDLDGDGDFDELYTLGGRSFSVWNADGNLVFDTGNEFEVRTAAMFPNNFNAGHTTNAMDDRSDNKGPEPEAVTVGMINDSLYAFIGCERIGHTFMYNLSNPRAPRYSDYINTRNFSVTPSLANVQNGTVGDLGCEILTYVPSNEVTGNIDLVLAANEISGTLSVFSVRIPRITSRPAATINACIGDRVTLTVGATGPSLSYVWSKNATPITNATSATYAFDVTSAASAGTYTCAVTADAGMTLTTTTVVNVFTRTVIETQPKALSQVSPNVTVVLELKATSTAGETYQWFKAGSPLTDNDKYQGARTNKLTIKWVTFADTSGKYYCVVTGGCSSVKSRDCAVYIPRILITQQPQSAHLCPGDTAVFRVSASPSGGDRALQYQWKIPGGPFLVEDARVKGVNTPTLTINGVTNVDASEYVCLITGFPSGEPLHSNNVALSLAATPRIIEQPSAPDGSTTYNVCEGGKAVIDVRAEGDGIEYQWVRNGLPIPLATQRTYTAFQNGVYHCVITGDCSRSTATTRDITVTYQERPVIKLQPQPTTRVTKGNSFILSVVMQPSTSPLRYQWFLNGNTIAGATSATYFVQVADRADAGTYVCKVANDCGIEESQNANVIVNEPVSSVDEESVASSKITVAPQPAAQSVTIGYRALSAGAVSFIVTDIHGRIVATLSKDIAVGGEHTTELDVQGLASGSYVVTIRNGADVQTATMVVQH